jgi:hypothetical protein
VFNETLVALRSPLLIHFVYPYERKTSGWNLLTIAPFLLMQVLYGFSKMIENVGIIRDRAGQLGECGVYWMERRMSGVI